MCGLTTEIAGQAATPRATPSATAQLNAIPYAIVCIDEIGRILAANAAAEELLGCSLTRLHNRHLPDVLHCEDDRLLHRMIHTEGTLVIHGIAVRLGHKRTILDLTVAPMTDTQGTRTVTLIEQSPNAIKERIDSLSSLHVGPAVLAHEIKNPLAAIKGAGQLLLRKLDSNDRPLAEIVVKEADRIAEIIDRMGMLGSLQPLVLEPCNPHTAIRSAVRAMHLATPAAIAIAEDFDPSLPSIRAHGPALEQVLLNLLANAAEACMTVEEPQVVVRTRFITNAVVKLCADAVSRPLAIEIQVIDNGPGVSDAMKQSVFDPFVTSKGHGMGLGLALAVKLMRQMDGRLVYERDERAQVTVFSVQIAEGRS